MESYLQTSRCKPEEFVLSNEWWENILKTNPSLVVNKFNVCSIFKKVWLRAVVPANVCNGLKKTATPHDTSY